MTQDWAPKLRRTGPRYTALADGIAGDIADGVLRPGDRLPPQRALARRLGLDLTTISRGYAEAQARGLVRGHVGRGTFVIDRATQPDRADRAPAAVTDTTMNLPPEPDDPALIAQMQAGLSAVSANLVALLRYQAPTGGEADRAAASAWLSMRGMVPALDRIAITPGAHAAMMAILGLLAEPGDTVLCEDITYPGLRSIAAARRLHLIGVPCDADGPDPTALDQAIATHAPRAAYLNPTLQNPTTRTIPTDRRMALAEILTRHGLPLIEDDAYGFIPAAAPAPMATIAPHLTWHIGGLAKCIGAGLRLAYVVAPDRREALSLAQGLKAANVMAAPPLIALATRWIEDGTADRIRRFIRAETRARQAIAADLMGKFTFTAAPEAFNIWLKLPPGWRRANVIARMAGHSVGILPSDAFTVLGEPAETLRINLGGPVGRDTLRADLDYLAHTLDYGLWAV